MVGCELLIIEDHNTKNTANPDRKHFLFSPKSTTKVCLVRLVFFSLSSEFKTSTAFGYFSSFPPLEVLHQLHCVSARPQFLSIFIL